MLYNKNQVRITNDKKKLVKKGKHWIVASAFVLALAAGGYTVAGQVNADTATKPQAQVVTATPQKPSVGQNDGGSKPSTNNSQNQNRMTPSKDSQSTSVANIASQAHKMYSSVWNNVALQGSLNRHPNNISHTQSFASQNNVLPQISVHSSDFHVVDRNYNNITIVVPNPGKFVKYISGNDGHIQYPEANSDGSVVNLTSDSSIRYQPITLHLNLSTPNNRVNTNVKLSEIPVNDTNINADKYISNINVNDKLGYKMENSDLYVIATPKTNDMDDTNSNDYNLSISLPNVVNIQTKNGNVSKNLPAIYFISRPANPIIAKFIDSSDNQQVGNTQILEQGYLGDYADLTNIKLNVPKGTILDNYSGNPIVSNHFSLNHVPFMVSGNTVTYYVHSIGKSDYQPPFYAEEVDQNLNPVKNTPLTLEHFHTQNEKIDFSNTFSDFTDRLQSPKSSDGYILPGNMKVYFDANFNSDNKIQYEGWIPNNNSSKIDFNGVNHNGKWNKLDPAINNSVWNYKGIPVIPYIKIKGDGPETNYLNAKNVQYNIGLYAPKDIPFLHGNGSSSSDGLLSGMGGLSPLGTTNKDTIWYFPTWSHEYREYPNGYKGSQPEAFVPTGTYAKIPLIPGQTDPGYFGEDTNNEFADSPEWTTDGKDLYVTFHDNKAPTYSLHGPSNNNDYNDGLATLDNVFVHKTLPEFKYDVFFIDARNGSTQLQSDVISQNGSDLGPFYNNPKYNFSGDPEKYHISTVMATPQYNLYAEAYDPGHYGSSSDASKDRRIYIFYLFRDKNRELLANIPAGYKVDLTSHSNVGVTISEGKHSDKNPNNRHNLIYIYVRPMPHQYTLGATSKIVGEDVSVPLRIQQVSANGEPTTVEYTLESKPYYTNFNDSTTITEPKELNDYANNEWHGYHLVSASSQSEVIPQPNLDGSNIKPIIWYYAPSNPKVTFFTPKVHVIDWIKPSNAINNDINTWNKEDSDVITLPTHTLSTDNNSFTFDPRLTPINSDNQSLNTFKSNEGYYVYDANSPYTWTISNINSTSLPTENYYTTDGLIIIKYVNESNDKVIGHQYKLQGNQKYPAKFNINDYIGDLLPQEYDYSNHYNYDNSQYNGNINPHDTEVSNGVHTVLIYVKKKESNITVNYVNKSNNKIIKKVVSDTEDINTPFDVGEYMDKIPNGYEYAGLQNDVDHFTNHKDIINIYLTKLPQSTITVNYIDKNTRHILDPTKIKHITKQVGTPFDISQYLNNLPTDYEYAGIENNTNYFESSNRTINIVLIKDPIPKVLRSTITVNYINADGDTFIQTAGSKKAEVSTPFDVGEYMDKIPNGYEYAGLQNDVDHFGYNDHTINILLNRVVPAHVASSTITINYVDAKDTNHVIKNAGKVTEKITTPFDIEQYLSNLPKDYEYAGIKGNVDSFDYNDHTIDVLLTKVLTPKIAKSTITVDYVNKASGSVIGKAGSKKAEVSTPFDVNEYMDKIPNGYEYAGLQNDVDHFGYNDQTVNILLNRVVPVHVASSTITINYVDAKDTNHVIKNAGKVTEKITTPFDIGQYLSNLPKGYEYAGIKGDVDSFDYNDHTVDVLLIKAPTSKVAKSTITVDYVNKASGSVIGKAGSDTEDITTPFDIGQYLSNLPKGYEYAGIKGDVDSFDYDNHTVSILLIKAPKFIPASSNAKPVKPQSAKSNGNSKASAKSKPTSKSSAKVVPNSASGAPDSSAIPANEPSSSVSNNASTNSSISSASMPSSASSVSASSATSSTNSSKASNTSNSTSNGKRSRNRAAMLKEQANNRYSRYEQREQKVGRRVYLDNLMSTNRSFKFGDHRFMNLRHSKRLPQTGESMTHSSAWAAALMGLSAVMAGLGHAVGFKKRHE